MKQATFAGNPLISLKEDLIQNLLVHFFDKIHGLLLRPFDYFTPTSLMLRSTAILLDMVKALIGLTN